MPLKDLLLVNSMLAFNDNAKYYMDEPKGHYEHIDHIKKDKDGRKVEYYEDEKGNIRRRKVN